MSTSPGWSEERKVATVLFADIAGFTTISSELEADAVWEFANSVFEPLTREVEKREGRVVKYIGDCLMAVFGVPRSSQDDARRAAQAALAMREVMHDLSTRWEVDHDRQLAIRVGMHTGTVMVGSVGSGPAGIPDLMGTAVNTASRLEGLAEPGQVLISRATWRQIGGLFRCEPLGERNLKGLSDPVEVYAVDEELEETDRRRGTEGLIKLESPQLLREEELAEILSVFDESLTNGRAGLVKIVGEPGLGKSRLLKEVRQRIEAHESSPIILSASSWVGATTVAQPMSLVGRLLRMVFDVRADEPKARARRRAVALIQKAWPQSERAAAGEVAETLADLAQLDLESSANTAALESKRAANDMIFGALLAWIERLLSKKPICFVVGDLQWADDSSLDLIERLLKPTSSMPVFTLAASQPELEERRPGCWEDAVPSSRRLNLVPLSRERMAKLLDRLLEPAPAVPSAVRQSLLDRAEGNPEYLTELIRWLIDRGAIVPTTDGEPWGFEEARLGEIDLPDTVLGLLQARLDGLPKQEKELLKRASVLGRTFWRGAAEQLWEVQDDQDVSSSIQSLIARGILRRRSTSSIKDEEELQFRNQAFRDAAYRLLPRVTREGLHHQAARWLTPRADSLPGGHAEIAGHLETAGSPAEARPHQVEAARRALTVYACQDALQLLDRALGHWGEDELLARADAHHQRAKALMALGSSSDAVHAIESALTDLKAGGADDDDPTFSWLDYELGRALKVQGDHESAEARFDIAIGRDSKREPSVVDVLLYGQRAWVRLARGNLNGANEDYEAGLAAASRIDEGQRGLRQALSVLSNVRGGIAMRSGDLAEAERCFRESIELAGEGDMLARYASLSNLGAIAFESGRFEAARASFEEGVELGRKLAIPRYEAIGLCNMGQALFAMSKPHEALGYLEQAVEIGEEMSLLEVLADGHRALAEVKLALDDPAGALEDAELAVAASRRGGQTHYEIPAREVAMIAALESGKSSSAKITEARDVAHSHLEAAVALLRTSKRPDGEALEARMKERFERASHSREAPGPEQ